MDDLCNYEFIVDSSMGMVYENLEYDVSYKYIINNKYKELINMDKIILSFYCSVNENNN